MAKLVISPLAEGDLNDILDFIASDKPEAANRWVEKIRAACQFLADNPEVGERRPEIGTGQCRSSIVGRYVIFYRVVPGGVEVARVVRGERDIRSV